MKKIDRALALIDEYVNGPKRNDYSGLFRSLDRDDYHPLWVYLLQKDLETECGISEDHFFMCDSAASGHVDYFKKMQSYIKEVIQTGKLSWESRFL